MDSAAIIKIQQCVDEVLNDINVYDENEYARLLQFAIRGVTELSLHHLRIFKRTKLPVSSIFTVQLPDDYIDYIRIGIDISGKIWTLSRNDNIILPDTGECGEDTNANTGTEIITPYFHFGATGGHNYASYRIDRERHRIVFDNYVPNNEIVLEYQSSGIKMDGQTYIPIEAKECLIAWIHWKRVQHDEVINPNIIMLRKSEYNEAAKTLSSFQNKFTIDELLDALRSGYKQTPKR